MSSYEDVKENNDKETRETIVTVAKLIHKAKIHVRGIKTSRYLEDALNVLKVILKDMNIDEMGLFERSSVQSRNICPESYMGGSFGFPFYQTGFEVDHCDYSVPIRELVTVIQYIDTKQNDNNSEMDNLEKFVASMHRMVNGMKTFIAINSETNSIRLKENYPNINLLPSIYRNEGFALNTLVKEVKTPYVLIARGVEFITNDSRLERLVHELESLNVVAVGGAFRYPNGHWHKGCFQTIYRNYVLKYISGYDESFHECLFCDYIQGPFLTTTKYLKSNVFEDFNENNGLFEDFFLRIFEKREDVVVCPDSMFYVKSKDDFKVDAMIGFLHKWGVFEIETTDGTTINGSCRLKLSGKKSLALPPCLLRANHKAVNDIMQICVEVGIACEIRDGTALGAIKFGRSLPWELDFDIGVSFDNCSKCIHLELSFLKFHITFNYFASACCTKKVDFGDELNFKISVRGYRGDLIGQLIRPNNELFKDGLQPTKVLYGGQWLNSAWNPGLYMRNRYGIEVYRHAEHWYYTGIKETKKDKINYTSGRFYPCTTPGAHNCLDSYNADGNMPFIVELLP